MPASVKSMAKNPTGTTRRKPSQQRSRERVEEILRATKQVIRTDGVNGLSPTAIAEVASIPTSALYQYFENSDAILRAYIDTEFERIALVIAESVMALEKVSLRSLFGAVAQAHIEYFRSNPEMIPLWIEGRLNPVVAETVSMHSGRLARFIDTASRRAGLIEPETPRWGGEVAVRGFDRVFEFIFSQKRSKREQQEISDFYLDMVSTYGEVRFATERGKAGIPVGEFIAALGGEDAVEPADFWAGTPESVS